MGDNRNSMEAVNVVFATDKVYILPTCVAIESVLISGNKNTTYHFWLMVESDIKLEFDSYLFNIKNKYNNCLFDFIIMDGLFENVPTPIKHISRPTYFRLILPNVINEDKCIYLDSDVVVCRDISNLYKTSMEKYEVAGVIALAYQVTEKFKNNYMKETGIPSMEQYINAGVLMMNLLRMRQNHFTEKAVAMISDILPSCDQDIINMVSYGKIKCLPLRYNFQAARVGNQAVLHKVFTKKEIEEAENSPCIVHYLKRQKPWEFFHIGYANIWWNICRKTTVYHEFLRKYEKSFYYYGIIRQGKLWKCPQFSDDWFNEAKNYRKIYVYGAGNYGIEVISVLRQKEIHIYGILVSAIKDNPHTLQEIPVMEWNINLDKNALIIIAADENNTVEIYRLLVKNGYFNIYTLDTWNLGTQGGNH